MSLSPRHLRLFVIRPVLVRLDLWSAAAEDLVLGTAAAETGLRLLDQVTSGADDRLGPAYGLWQMEEATHDDLWRNMIAYRPELRAQVEALLATWPRPVEQLVTNLAYAAALCRLHYRRVAEPLPAAGDLEGYGRYWKRHYNTEAGKGTPAGFVEKYAAAGCGFA
ncbi:hypothetical protein [Brevundimonas sp.]|uniref:hypothetical protein n=1 Tax=Brevundimonas sp. TaxID=1871086 RepID=UPI002D4DB9C0|nr:hypothetical protein [Brevundimonas sp.]HYD29182.1 hypothetical protein [Brevundimonas sp.]